VSGTRLRDLAILRFLGKFCEVGLGPRRCDYWSLGVIFYECIFGCRPFTGITEELLIKSILDHNRNLEFPYASPNAVDLMKNLLRDKDSRLSSSQYRQNDYPGGERFYVYSNDTDDLKAHVFFRSLKWDQLHVIQPYVTKPNSMLEIEPRRRALCER